MYDDALSVLDSKPGSDSKAHINPSLSGSSPSTWDDLPDDAELISLADKVESSQNPAINRSGSTSHIVGIHLKSQAGDERTFLDELKGKRKLDEDATFADVKPFNRHAGIVQTAPFMGTSKADNDMSLGLGSTSRIDLTDGPAGLPGRADPNTTTMSNKRHRSSSADVDRKPNINSSSATLDQKPNINQDEKVLAKSDLKPHINEAHLADALWKDFSSQVKNVISGLNQALGDFPPGPLAREFDLHSVQERATMILCEHFRNPHLAGETGGPDPDVPE
jgi:hypothetical protein